MFEHITQVLEPRSDIFIHHAAVITLDLFNDIGDLTGLAGKSERRILQIFEPPRVMCGLARR